jgi:hypothetical protein
MSAKPAVDGLERDWVGGQVIRLDITTPVGREFGQRHGFEFTPTFILFDGAGTEIGRWRGRPPTLQDIQRRQ